MSQKLKSAFILLILFFTPLLEASGQLPMKMDYAEGVIMNSENSKRIESSDNLSAKEKLEEAKVKFNKARNAQSSGEFETADKLTNEALRLVTSAAQMVPNKSGLSEKSKKRYQDLLKEIGTYQSWKKDYTGHEDDSQESHDMAKIQKQIKKAQFLAKENKHKAAVELLKNVLGIVVTYANSSLKSRTFTYDLNFETPIDEYKYEVNRNDDYERLLPIAISQKAPSAGMLSLIKRFNEKSKQMRSDAEDFFENKKYDEAVSMMKESTNQLVTSLKMVGVR